MLTVKGDFVQVGAGGKDVVYIDPGLTVLGVSGFRNERGTGVGIGGQEVVLFPLACDAHVIQLAEGGEVKAGLGDGGREAGAAGSRGNIGPIVNHGVPTIGDAELKVSIGTVEQGESLRNGVLLFSFEGVEEEDCRVIVIRIPLGRDLQGDTHQGR